MTGQVPRTSLVIVSRHRTDTLRRCLTGVAQMDHPEFELIVVADPAAAAMVRGLGLAAKVLEFDAANISAARNLGIRAASGAVVAFLDDDAVPEPSWLSRLAAPFADARVMAAGGWVRSRNGISDQWRAGRVDRLTRPQPLEVPPDRPSLHRGIPGLCIEIKGVNCAYRRSLLLELGGFDPELRYYLDETELNLRLAERESLVAIVPGAVVHHFKAGSRQRSARRVPLSLADVGASTAVTLRRHGAREDELSDAYQWLWGQERRKLIRHLVSGAIEPLDLPRLLASLRSGWEEGVARGLCKMSRLEPLAQSEDFLRFPVVPREGRVISGWIWQARRLRAEAARSAAAGRIVTLFLFDASPRWHWMRYDPQGFWEQSGGLWGWSLREGRRILRCGYEARLKRECLRIGRFRPATAEKPLSATHPTSK